MGVFVEVDPAVRFPVFVRELDDNSVKRFDNTEALRYLEAIDVENGEYEAWDDTGRVLRLSAEGVTPFKAGTIKVGITSGFVERPKT